MSKPTIALSHLRKSYSGHEVLHDISLTAQDGDVISLIGASGSGKSTLLRCIPFLEVPQGGEIAVGDDVVTIDNPDEKLSREQQRRITIRGFDAGVREPRRSTTQLRAQRRHAPDSPTAARRAASSASSAE